MGKLKLKKTIIGVLVSTALLGACGNTLLDEIRAVSEARAHQAGPRMLIVSRDATIDAGETVHIGSTTEGAKIERTFSVHNRGDAHLEITSVLHDNDLGLFSFATSPPSGVAPGSVASIVVAFTPASLGDVSAVFVIESNAADLQLWSVEITGSGVAAGSVISPESGELILPGQDYTIEWAPFPEGNVTIALYSSGVLDQIIASNISDSGSYQWPTTSTSGSSYRVRVTSVLNQEVWSESGVFSIGTISGASINAATLPYLRPNDTVTVQWTTTLPSSETVNVMLYQNGIQRAELVSNAGNTGSRQVTVPGSGHTGSGYRIRVVTTKNPAIFSQTEAFTIGTIRVSRPSEAMIWDRGTTETIEWSTGDLGGTVRIVYMKGEIEHLIAAGVTNSPGQVASHQWSMPNNLIPGNDYRIRVVFEPQNSIQHTSPYFTIMGPQLAVPLFSLAAGYYTANQSVTLTAPSNARVCYTTDGTIPDADTCDSVPSPHTFTVSNYQTTVRAISVRDYHRPSNEAQRTYHIPYRHVATLGGPTATGNHQLSSPRGLAFHNNRIYVADHGNNRIAYFNTDLQYIGQWTPVGSGRPMAFASPSSSSDQIWVAESSYNSAVGDAVRLYPNNGGPATTSITNARDAYGLLHDHSFLYIANTLSKQVERRHMDNWGSVHSYLGQNDFGRPIDIAKLALITGGSPPFYIITEYFYVSDANANQVRRYTWSSALNRHVFVDSAAVNTPYGIAVRQGSGPSGSSWVYVASMLGNKVVKLNPDGSYVTEFGTGSIGTGDGEFWSPWGIAIDSWNNVYVSDMGGNRVQKFAPNY